MKKLKAETDFLKNGFIAFPFNFPNNTKVFKNALVRQKLA